MEKSDVIDLLIEFGGGAELLFGNIKKHKVQLKKEESFKWTIKNLLPWIEKNLLKERRELFIQDDSVRPGILVLVNDADWELLQFLKVHKNAEQMNCVKKAQVGLIFPKKKKVWKRAFVGASWLSS